MNDCFGVDTGHSGITAIGQEQTIEPLTTHWRSAGVLLEEKRRLNFLCAHPVASLREVRAQDELALKTARLETAVYSMLEASTRTRTSPRPAVGRGASTTSRPSGPPKRLT